MEYYRFQQQIFKRVGSREYSKWCTSHPWKHLNRGYTLFSLLSKRLFILEIGFKAGWTLFFPLHRTRNSTTFYHSVRLEWGGDCRISKYISSFVSNSDRFLSCALVMQRFFTFRKVKMKDIVTFFVNQVLIRYCFVLLLHECVITLKFP